MNKLWSGKMKQVQSLMKKSTIIDSFSFLIELRNDLMKEMESWKDRLDNDDYSKQPFINTNGYHSKTVAYSIYHIIRIEDIVLNSLILRREEIFFKSNYQQRMNSSIVTTGNELIKDEIKAFSAKLNINELYEYAKEVKSESDKYLMSLSFDDLKKSFEESDKFRLTNLGVVGKAGESSWLIQYWTGKDIKGLVLMPFSRHWIMHIEAANRIISKIRNR